jgi:hypothetical protein
MDILTSISSELGVSQSATYSCVLTNNWSRANHPVQYPGSAHWSPPVVVSHSEGYEMWAPGKLASRGVERVAEVRCLLTLLLCPQQDMFGIVLHIVDHKQSLLNLALHKLISLILTT